MKRFAVAVTVLAALVLLAAPSYSETDRTVMRVYTAAGGTTASDYPNVFVQDASPNGSDESIGGALFEPDPDRGENRFSINVVDATGQPVAVRVFWVRPGRSEFGAPRTFCTGTTPTLKTNPTGIVQTVLVAGPCNSGASVPTRGEVTATFTRK